VAVPEAQMKDVNILPVRTQQLASGLGAAAGAVAPRIGERRSAPKVEAS
jgi:hypothetical protein